MDQKLEAHAITPVYASRNQELQSLAKEQLQRYASTYLGVDPRTIDVTLPWQRLFEVYVDVKKTPSVSLEADVRQGINNQRLQNLANNVAAAQAQLDAAHTVDEDGTVVPPDPAVQAQLQLPKRLPRRSMTRNSRPRPSIAVKKRLSRAVPGRPTVNPIKRIDKGEYGNKRYDPERK